MMPLIDVIFLLLTFFIYAMVLLVPADLLPVQLPQFVSGEPARPAPAVTVSIDRTGTLYVNREALAADEVLARLRQAKDEHPDTVIYVACEEAGDTDRLPVFLDLCDRLALAGLEINLVGRRDE